MSLTLAAPTTSLNSTTWSGVGGIVDASGIAIAATGASARGREQSWIARP